MKASCQVRQQRFSRRPQRVPIRPPAVAAQLLLEMTPDPLHQVQLRRVGWQEERTDLALPLTPPGEGFTALVVAHVVQDHHELVVGPGVSQLIQEPYERLCFCGDPAVSRPPRWRNPGPQRLQTSGQHLRLAPSWGVLVSARLSPAGDGDGLHIRPRRPVEPLQELGRTFFEPVQHVARGYDSLGILPML